MCQFWTCLSLPLAACRDGPVARCAAHNTDGAGGAVRRGPGGARGGQPVHQEPRTSVLSHLLIHLLLVPGWFHIRNAINE